MDQYFTDFRNASAAAWFVDTVVGRVARSPHADGVWFGASTPVALRGAPHDFLLRTVLPATHSAVLLAC